MILIIEDEPAIRRLLRHSLEPHQFEVVEGISAAEGIALAAQKAPQLILLDLGLPDAGGLSVIRKIREASSTPIIVLTVQDDEAIKIEALDLGADDYLTKPFSVPELLARIRVALRHAKQGNSLIAPASLQNGIIDMDLAAHTVKVSGNLVKLTVTEFEILKVLLKNSEKVVTHRQLLKEVWGPNSVEHTQYLRVYVAQVRKKLGAAGEQIETETGIGYRCKCP